MWVIFCIKNSQCSSIYSTIYGIFLLGIIPKYQFNFFCHIPIEAFYCACWHWSASSYYNATAIRRATQWCGGFLFHTHKRYRQPIKQIGEIAVTVLQSRREWIRLPYWRPCKGGGLFDRISHEAFWKGINKSAMCHSVRWVATRQCIWQEV